MGATTSDASKIVSTCFNDDSCVPLTSSSTVTAFSSSVDSPSVTGERKWPYFVQSRENPLNKAHSMVSIGNGKPKTTATTVTTTVDATSHADHNHRDMTSHETLSDLRLYDNPLEHDQIPLVEGAGALTVIVPYEEAIGSTDVLDLLVSEKEIDFIFVAIMTGNTNLLQSLIQEYKTKVEKDAVEMEEQQHIGSKQSMRFAELTWKKHPYYGCSVLHIAVLSCSVDMVKVVLELGAHLYTRDQDGNTALAIAYALGYIEMIDLITKHASKQFSMTPCSPCASSMFSKPNNNSVISDDNLSITESISSIDISYLRGRAASFSSTLDIANSSQRHISRKRASSMSIEMGLHELSQSREHGLVEGIALSQSFEKNVNHESNNHQALNDGIPPLALSGRHRHVCRDSGTISFPGSIASSEGLESLTTSSVSDLTVDSSLMPPKTTKKISKKIRKVASKALRFISK